jgi:hypothetical protein
MIEALACGTPVLATGCGSAPELIDDGDTGFVRTELPALAEALHSVGELDRNRCREKAVSCYSTERMVAEHVQLYCELQQAKPKDRRGRLLTEALAPGGTIPRNRPLAEQVLRRPSIAAKSR